jgi:hypothetical protein
MSDIYGAERLRGSAVVYAADTRGKIEIDTADFEVERGCASHPAQLRHDYVTQDEGPDTETMLTRQVLVLTGGGVAPWAVISCLKRIIKSIEKDGLAVGRDPDGRLYREGGARRPTPSKRKRNKELMTWSI